MSVAFHCRRGAGLSVQLQRDDVCLVRIQRDRIDFLAYCAHKSSCHIRMPSLYSGTEIASPSRVLLLSFSRMGSLRICMLSRWIMLSRGFYLFIIGGFLEKNMAPTCNLMPDACCCFPRMCQASIFIYIDPAVSYKIGPSISPLCVLLLKKPMAPT